MSRVIDNYSKLCDRFPLGGLYIANEKIYLHTNGVGSPVNIENFNLVGHLPIYPDDFSAGVRGLVKGDIFCSADGIMRIKQ